MEELTDNYFIKLNSINVNDKVEQKAGLTYLSWAYAWGEVKKNFPDSTYKVYESPEGWNYFTDGKTCWVKTGVTIKGIEHIEFLPVMDYKNKSIPLASVTSFDVNKTIQRSLTKACARHGIGLYIYAGEDLPEISQEIQEGADELKKEISKEKAKDTREKNKKVEEANQSEDGLKLRYESAKALITKMKEIIPARDLKLIDRATALMNDLSEAGMETERKDLYDSLNSRMLKIDDELPSFA